MNDTAMEFLSRAAVRSGAGVSRRALRAEAELARLQAQLARLQAEQEALRWAASHDELTGLPNRRHFFDLVTPLLGATGGAAAVIVLDLDGFKPVNDEFGHEAGDRVLCVVGQRLAGWAGAHPVARLGGDEFAAVLTRPDPATGQWWDPPVSELTAVIARPISVARRTVRVKASIGVAPADGPTPVTELLRRADLAMYRAKSRDRGDRQQHPEDPPAYLELTVFERPQPADVPPAGTYRPGDPVWIHRDGQWRPGVVESASPVAVTARYRCAEGLGTVVDTVCVEHVAAREHVDSPLDRELARSGAAA